MITVFFTTSGAAVIALAFFRSPTGDVPDDRAGLPVERHQVRVERAHVEPIAQNREAAVHRSAADRGREKFAGSARR